MHGGETLLTEIAALLPRAEVPDVGPATRLLEDLGLDSLDLVELLGRIEDQLGVVIPTVEGVKVETVGALVERVRREIAGAREVAQ